jgi:uncharacterized repeat protein (TIGR01451 family)
VAPDGTAAYTIVARNDGPATSGSFSVSLDAPPGGTRTSFTSGGLNCFTLPFFGSGAFTCHGSAASPGWSTVLTVTYRLSTSAGSTLRASAHTSPDDGDPKPSNNDTSFTSLVVAEGNPVLHLDPTVITAQPSKPFHFTALVDNDGGAPLAGITVMDTAPAGMTFVSATPSSGTCEVTASSLQCHADSLAAGASLSINIAALPPPASLFNHVVVTAGTKSASANLLVSIPASGRRHAVHH